MVVPKVWNVSRIIAAEHRSLIGQFRQVTDVIMSRHCSHLDQGISQVCVGSTLGRKGGPGEEI